MSYTFYLLTTKLRIRHDVRITFKLFRSVCLRNYDVSSLSAGHLYAHFHSPIRRRVPRVRCASESKLRYIKINKSLAFRLFRLFPATSPLSFSLSPLSLNASKLFSTKASTEANKNKSHKSQTHDGTLGEKVWATKLLYPAKSVETFAEFSKHC